MKDLRRYEPEAIDNPYFTFEKDGADFYVIGASRKVKELHEVTKNSRGYYIKLKDKKFDQFVRDRFSSFDWYSIGTGVAGGGVVWINQEQINAVFQV